MKDRVLGVREAVEADGDAIGEAHAAAWLAAYSHIFDATFLAGAAESRRVGWPRVMQRLLTPPSVLFVGEVDHHVVAFAHGARRLDSGSAAEIRAFYSHPDAWGTGVATLLMTQTCASFGEEFDEVTLWTLRDAHRARRFYESAGFSVTGNARLETLSDWTTGIVQEAPSVEYAMVLHPTGR